MQTIYLSDSDRLATIKALAFTAEAFARIYGDDHDHTRKVRRALGAIAGPDGDAARKVLRPVVAQLLEPEIAGGAA